MTSSLVGSEMCIRDRIWTMADDNMLPQRVSTSPCTSFAMSRASAQIGACLLYTSDAADDM
eukprot:9538003-Prorocentrum_lima.AAC.1